MPLAANYGLCTPAEVRAELGNDDTAAAMVDTIQLAINTASLWAEWKCGRQFRKYDHATVPLSILEGDGMAFERSIFLPWPVLTLTKVEEGGVELVAGVDYRVLAAKPDAAGAEIIRMGVDWQVDEVTAVKLTGTFGWNWTAATDAAPPDSIPFSVRRAVRLAAAAFSGENQKESIAPDGQRLNYIDKRVPAEALRLLAGLAPTF